MNEYNPKADPERQIPTVRIPIDEQDTVRLDLRKPELSQDACTSETARIPSASVGSQKPNLYLHVIDSRAELDARLFSRCLKYNYDVRYASYEKQQEGIANVPSDLENTLVLLGLRCFEGSRNALPVEDAVNSIVEKNPDAIILISTGDTTYSDDMAQRAGADGVLHKPVVSSEFLETIKFYLE